VYRLCLFAFPRGVRRAHGREMLAVFEALVARRRRKAGAFRAAFFAIRMWIDALSEGWVARIRLRDDGRRGRMLDDLWTDLRHSIRALAKSPVHAFVLVVTLALGVGATTAIFSLLYGVLYTPLPYDDPGELVSVVHRATNVEGVAPRGPGGTDLVDYMDGVPSIDGLGGVQTLETNLNDDDGAARVVMGWTTPDFFQVIGVQASLGRVLRADDWAGADRARMEDPDFTPPPMAVLLSHGLWARRFGEDPDVLGRTLRLNGQAMNVVGVLPPSFRLHMRADAEISPDVDAWALMPVPLIDAGRGLSGLTVIGRLADGATLDRARAEMEGLLEELTAAHEVHARLGTVVEVDPLHDQVVGPAKALLWPLFGAVSLLLLIACINVANLLLVRASAREREFAVRAALGVGRARVVRQLLTESLVVALLGTGAGVVLALLAVEGLVGLGPANLPRLEAVSLEGSVLWISVVASVMVAVTFGLAPALTSARVSGQSLLSTRGVGTVGPAGVQLRRWLIVGELAVSVVLVAGAGLLVRSFAQLRAVDLGVDPESVVAVDVAVPFFSYRDDATRSAFFVQLAERAQTISGVKAAGVTARLPLEPGSGGTWNAPYAPVGEVIEAEDAPRARYRSMTPGAMEALGLRLREGRGFVAADEQPGDLVSVVVDSGLAGRYWPDGAVGQSLEIRVAGYTGQPSTVQARVVGVTEPARFTSVAEADEPTIYVPYHQFTPVDGTLVLRSDRDAAEIAAEVRSIVGSLDGSVPVFSVRTFGAVVDGATAEARHALWLMGAFAVTALILAAVGLYGVISTLALQRTREIGVRLALGAVGGDIARMIGVDGVRLVVPGLLAGLVLAFLASPLLRALLYQVEPVDPATLGVTVIVLGTVGLVASLLPAARAARMDPVEALREE
jgi:predicted permease